MCLYLVSVLVCLMCVTVCLFQNYMSLFVVPKTEVTVACF
jgi:hypothetical protein